MDPAKQISLTLSWGPFEANLSRSILQAYKYCASGTFGTAMPSLGRSGYQPTNERGMPFTTALGLEGC